MDEFLSLSQVGALVLSRAGVFAGYGSGYPVKVFESLVKHEPALIYDDSVNLFFTKHAHHKDRIHFYRITDEGNVYLKERYGI